LRTADKILRPVAGETNDVRSAEPATGETGTIQLGKLQRGASAGKRRTAVLHAERKRKVVKKAEPKSKPSDDAGASDATKQRGGMDHGGEDDAPISRKDLLEKALRIIARDLDAEGGERPTNTIGSLVQLLKLDRSIKEDEEQPHEIRVVWQQMDDETEIDSAGKSSGE
jgi:hypothetical protein